MYSHLRACERIAAVACRILCLILIVLFGLAIRPEIAQAILPPDSVDFVIVTTADLVPEFERLASYKEAHGLTTTVVTLDWIQQHVTPGRDLQETIRHFLQEAHADWGIGYALLGGDAPLLPPRYVTSTFYPPGGTTDIPADLYFAGLEGDWDADGDGNFGEPYASPSSPGDDADLGADVAVGRAPVNDLVEAAVFVDKSIAFAEFPEERAVDRALILGEVLLPWDWQEGDSIVLDGAAYCQELLPIFDAADPAWEVARLYENHTAFPGAEELSRQAVLDSLQTGRFRLVHHTGRAVVDSLSFGSEYILPEDVAALANGPDFFFIVSWFGSSAAFDSTSMIERLLLDPDGGCAGGMGGSRVSFPSTAHDYAEAFYEEALLPENPLVGDALVAALARFENATYYNTVRRWTHLITALLADPTIPSKQVLSVPSAVAWSAPPTAKIRVLPCVPNPFNPVTRLRFELPGERGVVVPVQVTVHDTAGRRVATLLAGTLKPGWHEVVWDGRDDEGRSVAAGGYLAVVLAGDAGGSVKATLVR